jgi:short-subunit dehydrogenase
MDQTRKYAVVTGASSGIGWHISEALAHKGYDIIAVSNQPSLLGDLKKKLEQTYQITAVTVDIDLAKENAAQKIFSYCEKNNLEIEILVNNAGILVFGEAVQVEYSKTIAILNLHMTTPALLCRLFGEQMIRRKRGFILNVSSISAVMPYPGISLYGPTKAFIRYFTRALRTEMNHYGIKVTCLIPGATATALYKPGNFDNPVTRNLGVIKCPETVAKAAVNALFKNRAVCIPGLLNKLTVFLLPLVPQFIIGLIHSKTDIVKKME